MQAAGEEASSEETIPLVQQQLSKLRQFHNVKDFIDRRKSEVEGALASKRSGGVPGSGGSTSALMVCPPVSESPLHVLETIRPSAAHREQVN